MELSKFGILNEAELTIKHIHIRSGVGYVFKNGHCPERYKVCHQDCKHFGRWNNHYGCDLAVAEIIFK